MTKDGIEVGRRYKHRKGECVVVIAKAVIESTSEIIVVFRHSSEQSASCRALPVSEFADGRFSTIREWAV